jgi:quercetin dioxygenase-like cupin family protein
MILPPQPDRSKAQPAANPEYFEGRVLMQPLVSASESGEVELLAVFFDAGARTIPHVHETDQVLCVVDGRCVVGDASGRREFGAGEWVLLPAHQWHWHGAVRAQQACHVSIRKPGPTNWAVERRDW